jgi:hypothetical protein
MYSIGRIPGRDYIWDECLGQIHQPLHLVAHLVGQVPSLLRVLPPNRFTSRVMTNFTICEEDVCVLFPQTDILSFLCDCNQYITQQSNAYCIVPDLETEIVDVVVVI